MYNTKLREMFTLYSQNFVGAGIREGLKIKLHFYTSHTSKILNYVYDI